MSSIVITGESVLPADKPERPRVPVSPRSGIRRGYPFTCVHHHEWAFYEDEVSPEGGEWRPEVSEIRHAPGANGVSVRGGKIYPQAAWTGNITKGGIVIPVGDRRLGEFADYQRRYLLTDGGYFFCFSWVKVSTINRGRDAVTTLDKGKQRGFQMQLLKGGIVDPMSVETLNTHITMLEARIGSYDTLRAQGQLDQAAYEAKEREIQAMIVRMRAAWERDFGGFDETEAIEVSGDSVDIPDGEMVTEDIATDTPKPTRGRSRK